MLNVIEVKGSSFLEAFCAILYQHKIKDKQKIQQKEQICVSRQSVWNSSVLFFFLLPLMLHFLKRMAISSWSCSKVYKGMDGL